MNHNIFFEINSLCMKISYDLCLTDISLGCFIVWIASLNYWRNPKYGLRRTLDFTCAIGCCGYLTYSN